jgi:hypothetical protein
MTTAERIEALRLAEQFIADELERREIGGFPVDNPYLSAPRIALDAVRETLDALTLSLPPREREPATDPHLDQLYREAARKIYQRDGAVEIDDNAVISYGSDPGAYVAAWVWVYDDSVNELAPQCYRCEGPILDATTRRIRTAIPCADAMPLDVASDSAAL